MDKIKVGIIGTGGISRWHQKTYIQVGGFETIAVCDIIKQKALQAAEEWGVPKKHAFTSYNKMLEMDEIDAVSVCTYNQGHRRPVVAALQAGKHVFCEKPMAVTLADATAMVRAAKAAGKILQIGIHNSFSPELRFAKRAVDEGVLGEITMPKRQAVGGAASPDTPSSTKKRQALAQLSTSASTTCTMRCL